MDWFLHDKELHYERVKQSDAELNALLLQKVCISRGFMLWIIKQNYLVFDDFACFDIVFNCFYVEL